MTHTYLVNGMTCDGCVTKVRSELLKLGDVTEAEVQLSAPQATISMQKHIPLTQLQSALSKAGRYTISEADAGMHLTKDAEASWFKTYKPILLIGAYLSVITLFVSVSSGNFSAEFWMSNFMAGFFLVFSFFKLLDLKAFADSYASYDIIARRWHGWGFIYVFIELLLGLAFLLRLNPLLVNGVAFAVMGISIIGVLKSVLNKQKIQCACLGTVFNLPMSTVTITEDALMIVMSGFMIFQMI
ncbi:MAG: heavy-metal-associated domain-containing protein [Flavisolibacter sp.]